ncbi:hypothetical protein [Desulfobacter curvatus]|uniref:hypothetical protein n=1 Tax=Desulfobacter curvatus TaxID=2290 RepID=UPI00037919C0|nr:hypothetical protein [Desulfobacter curvatus]
MSDTGTGSKAGCGCAIAILIGLFGYAVLLFGGDVIAVMIFFVLLVIAFLKVK